MYMNICRLFVKSEKHKRWFQVLDWIFGIISLGSGFYYNSPLWIGIGIFSMVVAAFQPMTHLYRKFSFIKPAPKLDLKAGQPPIGKPDKNP